MSLSSPPLISAASIDEYLLSLMRTTAAGWPFPDDPQFVQRFLDRICYHGVQCLLYANKPCLQQLPASLGMGLQGYAREHALWELRHRKLLTDLCDAFAEAGIELLILKGAAVAYTLYENPVLRTRSDTDLLIRSADFAKAIEVLLELGYERGGAEDSIMFSELALWMKTPEGSDYCIDLHWQLNNSPVLASLYSFDELLRESVTLPVYGGAARTIGLEDSFLVACVHRSAHKGVAYTANGITEYQGNRLIWLCDIDKLVTKIPLNQLQVVFERAHEKGCSDTVYRAMQDCHVMLGTPLPEVMPKHDSGYADRYLLAGSLRRSWLDLKKLTGWKAKMDFVVKQVFPPISYMREKYPDSNWHIYWLYLLRFKQGVIKRWNR